MKRIKKILIAICAMIYVEFAMFSMANASCDPEGYWGSVCWVGYDFCPTDFLVADGRELKIVDNPQLYSLLEYRFGGKRNVTFRLPDLRGRSVYGAFLADKDTRVGNETLTLTEANMPSHTHSFDAKGATVSTKLHASDAKGTSKTVTDLGYAALPSGAWYADSSDTETIGGTVSGSISEATGATEQTGNAEPINLRPPQIALTACIKNSAPYPPRE